MPEDKNDEITEEFVEEEAEAGPAAIKKLREKLNKAVAEKQEYLDGWQRSRADFANFKREEAQMQADKEERIKADLIETLIPALDTLELSLKHEESQSLKMIEKQFLSALGRIGIERYGAEGDIFDPRMYEAIDQKGVPEKEKDNTVLQVRRSGYRIGEKNIRPAEIILGTHQRIDEQ